jgi:polygalacturonase
MKKPILFACLVLYLIPVFSQYYNIMDYGAVADGKTMNTKSIQNAIDRCSETGGTVYIPQGTFLSGTIFMKSNVTLHLSSKAVLKASASPGDYPNIFDYLEKGDSTKIRNPDTRRRCQVGFVVGQNLHKVGIEGSGTIDGSGTTWTGSRVNDGPDRPNCVMFIYCEDVVIKDFTLKDAVNWAHYYLKCNRVQIKGIKINSITMINNDGLDIESSNVTVSDCIIDSDDDGIVLKSSDREPIENITITNCQIGTNCNGIKFGTSSLGGFRNVTISNCVIHKASQTVHWFHQERVKDIELPLTVISGLALEIVDGGIMENILINTISMKDVQTPVFIRLADRGRIEKPGEQRPLPGKIRNVVLSNIIATSHSKMTSSITGQPGYPVENIQLNNILISSMGRGTAEEATIPVPDPAKSYPENRAFGYSLPCYGFYVRHARDISFQNVGFVLRSPDARPAYAMEDVENISVTGRNDLDFFVKKQIEKINFTPEDNYQDENRP